jgi:preprotein translocase subunit SecY
MTLGLGRRVAFTVGALVVYCLGTYIPVPGIDGAATEQLFRGSPGAMFSMVASENSVFAGLVLAEQ